ARQTLLGRAEDTAVVNLVLDNGMLAQINVAFNTPYSRTGLEVHGTQGSIVTSTTLGQVCEGSGELVTNESSQPIRHRPRNLYAAEIAEFGCAVRGEAPLAPTGEAGLEN
ncbi:MAG TPA: Gfo/Idh/MocA family oxidoreductase, partial [Chloroflexia bacterium]|nr:Gfo/Idh/MocA family oxidoreductase [Chloroflexia bacterium]